MQSGFCAIGVGRFCASATQGFLRTFKERCGNSVHVFLFDNMSFGLELKAIICYYAESIICILITSNLPYVMQ